MSKPLLTIRNCHRLACGDPPIVKEPDRDTYVGYFENQYCAQWVFTCNRSTGHS